MTDIMLVNKRPFVVSTSLDLKFTTIEYISSMNEIALVTSINKIVSYCKSHGLHVGTMVVKSEFQLLEEKEISTAINTTGVHEHVPEV